MKTIRLSAQIITGDPRIPGRSRMKVQDLETEIPEDAPEDAAIQDLGMRLARLVRNQEAQKGHHA